MRLLFFTARPAGLAKQFSLGQVPNFRNTIKNHLKQQAGASESRQVYSTSQQPCFAILLSGCSIGQVKLPALRFTKEDCNNNSTTERKKSQNATLLSLQSAIADGPNPAQSVHTY
jgi:hypothetical protein